MNAFAARLQSSWIRNRRTYFNKDNVAELRCAAALAATGHLISVKYMVLRDLELPSSEDMPSLASRVSGRVLLDGVTGDIGPLLTSLTCTWLWIEHTGDSGA